MCENALTLQLCAEWNLFSSLVVWLFTVLSHSFINKKQISISPPGHLWSSWTSAGRAVYTSTGPHYCSVVSHRRLSHEPRSSSAVGNISEGERLKQRVMREEFASHHSMDLGPLSDAFITTPYRFNIKGGQVQKEFTQSALCLSLLSASLWTESSRAVCGF